MSDWKDTVMSDDDINVFAHYPDVNLLSEDNWSIDNMLEAQAEISYKIGYNQALNEHEWDDNYYNGKKAGRKEVVDYIEEQNDLEDEEPLPYYVMNKKVWQAKKKEWGLKNQSIEGLTKY